MLNLKNTLDGYLKNVEVVGNTIQNTNNLADIRSVGDKLEGQELYNIDVVSCGKNFYNGSINKGKVWNIFTPGHKLTTSSLMDSSAYSATDIFVIKPNTTFTGHINGKLLQGNIKFYDKNQCYLTDVFTLPTTSPSDAHYCTIHYVSSLYSDVDNIQLEYGTQATPYEPYQEQKLEILSPVQLEKVGNVADRIICKDGVWGVEKIILNKYIDKSQTISYVTNYGNVYRYDVTGMRDIFVSNLTAQDIICDKYTPVIITTPNVEGIAKHGSNKIIQIQSKISDLQEFKNQLNINIKVKADTPQFIPLPHDQQVKLRTFAGQTNVFFNTEIPGQIKAQVPKSLGATVNTHTEQIKDLHNSLNRVKKLEETTVSTIGTESNFTTVNETSNGYFEDVKLEGKTLVNINDCSASFITSQSTICHLPTSYSDLRMIKPNTIYTAIVFGRTAKFNNSFIITDIMHTLQLNNNGVCLFKTFSEIDYARKFVPHLYGSGLTEEDSKSLKLVILEGDHTQNPPEYFEGLMSVGQDVEELTVTSIKNDGNLFDGKLEVGSLNSNGDTQWISYVKTGLIPVKPSSEVVCKIGKYKGLDATSTDIRLAEYDRNKNFISYKGGTSQTKVSNKTYYIKVAKKIESNDDVRVDINAVSDVVVVMGDKLHDVPHQSNKKPLLYYNPTTETWEKPILREWDTIEKHSDGKYYYHKRSGEVVLNGNESGWVWHNADGNRATIGMEVKIKDKFVENKSSVIDIICDRLTCISADDSYGKDLVGVASRGNLIRLRLDPSVVGGNDVPSMKSWLQTNPITVVYRLEQEEVYECTNIDLMTYNGETNYIINSGAISPKSLLKVHNNISNVVKILQEKVSLLESTFIAGLKSVLSGDMYSLATILYPEDFEQNDNTEQDIMVIPE